MHLSCCLPPNPMTIPSNNPGSRHHQRRLNLFKPTCSPPNNPGRSPPNNPRIRHHQSRWSFLQLTCQPHHSHHQIYPISEILVQWINGVGWRTRSIFTLVGIPRIWRSPTGQTHTRLARTAAVKKCSIFTRNG